MGFEIEPDDVVTPAALALDYCRKRGHEEVRLLVSDSLREDLTGLEATAPGEPADAVVLGDLGDGFAREVLDDAFRGALDAGIRAVLVRTGKYREDAVRKSGVQPTDTIDSIADLPELLAAG